MVLDIRQRPEEALSSSNQKQKTTDRRQQENLKELCDIPADCNVVFEVEIDE